jgi:uncharacterized protein (DUF885 family)
MKKLFSIFVFIFLTTITFAQNKKQPANPNSIFDNYKEPFVLALWKQYPNWASSQGFHAYDSVLIVPDEADRKSSLAFCNQQLEALKKINVNTLSDYNKIDYKMMEAELQSRKWYTTDFKSYEWNPSNYNVCGDFAEMLANNYDSIDTRLHNFYLKMKNVKAYYEAAKQNIKNPTVEHTNLAIEQNTGGLSTFNEDLLEALAKSHLTEIEKERIIDKGQETMRIINGYVSFLKELKNNSPHSFRIGKDLYSKKFEYDIASSFSATEIYAKAVAHKNELHAQMYAITKTLWPSYMQGKAMPENKLGAIKQMIDAISVKHVSADSFQTAIEQQIPTLVNFIKDKNLLYLDPSKPLVVRKEPAYMAGVAGASMSSPGPYDKGGNSYYNVGSFSGWKPERIESYLREYNFYILQILNIHEALPGHYAQLVYANKSPSIIKSIFGNGAMVEGWAVYTEKMMLENGYGKIPGNSEDEMMLMYSKWNLRSTCNTILDYNVHVNNLSKEDAIQFLTNEAFQQQAEAEGKWKRVSVTQVQLASYFTGYTEIYDLREQLKKKQGAAFNLKAFHEKFLSYGSAPVKYIRELMLK